MISSVHNININVNININIGCQSANGKPCVFPWTYKNKTFTGCTTEFDDKGQAWCSTKTINGDHVIGQGEWGYCSHGCPSTGQDTVIRTPSSWSSWSVCSRSCGRGSKQRSRSDGRVQTLHCNKIVCPTTNQVEEMEVQNSNSDLHIINVKIILGLAHQWRQLWRKC